MFVCWLVGWFVRFCCYCCFGGAFLGSIISLHLDRTQFSSDSVPRIAGIQRSSPNVPMQQHGACLLGSSPRISLETLLLGFQYVGK